MGAGVMLRWFCPCVPFGTLHGLLQFLLLFQLLRIAAFAKSGETLGRFAPFVQRLYPDIVLLVPVRLSMDDRLGQSGGVHLPLLRLAQMLRFLHGQVGFAKPQMLRFFGGFVCVQFQLFLLGTACPAMDFFGGERVLLRGVSSLNFSFGSLISARLPILHPVSWS